MKRRLLTLLILILALGVLPSAWTEQETFDDHVLALYRLEGEPERYLIEYYEETGWERYIYWDIVDADGNQIAEHFADKVYASPGGWYAVRTDGSWYIMDARGEITREPVFEEFESFQSNGLAAVKQDGLWGLIKADGSWLVEPCYDEPDYHWYDDMLRFFNGAAVAVLDGKYGYLREDGSYLFEPQFDGADDFWDGPIARIILNDLYGYVTADGEVLFEPQFDGAESFGGRDTAVVEMGGLKGYVNRQGEIAIRPRFEEADWFRGAYARVKQDGLYGYIDESGEYAVEPSFADADYMIVDGIAAVSVDGDKWGYIRMNGEYLFEPQFDWGGYLLSGMAMVYDEGGYGLVREDGTFLLNTGYSWLFAYIDGGCFSFHHTVWNISEHLEKALDAGEEVVIIAETDEEVFNFELVDGELIPIPVKYKNEDPWNYY